MILCQDGQEHLENNMNMFNGIFNTISKVKIIRNFLDWLVIKIGNINWAPKNYLTINEINKFAELTAKDYYIIVSRNNNHLSTYLINLGHFLLTGKKSYWAHGFMNMEDTVINKTDYRFVEAIKVGTIYATLEDVTAVNSIALLKPKCMPVEEWTLILDKAKSELGKPYDTLYDLAQDERFSCVELIRISLMASPDYMKHFGNFEALVQKYQRVTPQMFYDCEDFSVVYEIRHY